MVDKIKSATGKKELTYVQHNLKVRSVYTDVENFECTEDANKEPLVTSYNKKKGMMVISQSKTASSADRSANRRNRKRT
jgi:hypothetical protein